MKYLNPISVFLLLLLVASISPTCNVNARLISSSGLDLGSTLAARLKVEEGTPESSNCWDSLFELQACTGEVLTFFLNGETYLGPACCKAVHVIQHQCWPHMLRSLGFTSQEDDILLGYCNAEIHKHNNVPPSHSPPSVHTAMWTTP